MITAIQRVLRTLTDAGFEAYVVGGYVRDHLIGRPTKDADITTSATPDQVEALFAQVHTPGKAHGTINVVVEGVLIDVTTYRSDGAYDNHRHPNDVVFATSLAEDVRRRDFTINALAMAPDGTITDLVGGQDDLKHQRLRAIGEPGQRLKEDALRILRALRFQSELGFFLEESLYAAMKEHASLIVHLSKERVMNELSKMLQGPYLTQALASYHDLRFEGLPSTLRDRPDLRLAEQCAIAHLQEGWDATAFPWTKQDHALVKAAATLSPSPPTPLDLYRLAFPRSLIKIGSIVYQWDEHAVMREYESLLIHTRSDLTIDGRDLLALGLTGPAIDAMFERLEDAVLHRVVPNKKAELLRWIKEQPDEN
jgi:tRNA nucleotidyltransferase (CCA-adding enzyme)